MAARLISAGPDRYALSQNSDINVTPFVDVMMVLLIVFMVALPAATTSLKLDLPPASESADAAPPTIVSLRPDGRLYIGERATTLSGLSADLASAMGAGPPAGKQLYVRADRGVRYGAFLAVVDRLHADGYRKVGLVNEAM